MNEPRTAMSDHPAPRSSDSRTMATPTPLNERALAPDLARGFLLLFIALAHVPWFLYQSPVGPSSMHPIEGSIADRVAQTITIIAVDARTHTMFAFLFAYGIGQLYNRQRSRGASATQARRLLRRRHLWLLVLGACHAVLLWQGDILGTYGLIGLLLLPLFISRRDRTLRVWLVVFLSLGALISIISTISVLLAPAASEFVPADMQRLSIAEESYLVAALHRAVAWAFGLFSGLVTLALPIAFLAGLLAARHRVLEEPGRHLRLLRRLAILGITIGVLPGIGLVLEHLGLVTVDGGSIFAGLHFFTGIGQGIGYVALFGLLAHAITQRDLTAWLPVRAVVALGRRSLSGYLAQSVLFIPALAAWGLGLGPHFSSWSMALIAVTTWLITVVGAFALDRAGRRGPAEVLLRRLTYRPSQGV